MKFVYCIIISLCSYCEVAQNNLVFIKGVVQSDLDNERIENALVHLKVSNGGMFEARTNNQGEYSFKIENDTSLRFLVSVAATSETKSKNSNKNYRFLNIQESETLYKIKLGEDYIKDFKLTVITHYGMSFPRILFKRNSTQSYNNFLNTINSKEYDSFENSIGFICNILKDNPTIAIEIAGHASALEKKTEALSLERAELIKKKLVAKGISSSRIYTKGFGNRTPFVTDQMINEAKNAKTKEEKAALHLKNQRVVFRIVSWDYVEEKK